MITFLLVHGGWQGAWCWSRLTPLLAPYAVLAPDLPGHGEDRTPRSVLHQGSYLAALYQMLAGLGGPVVLAGHSSGGMLITELAARDPAAVKALVYVSAFLLTDGRTPPEVMRADSESMLNGALRNEDGASVLDPADGREIFFHDCPEPDRWAALLQPEPVPFLLPADPKPAGARHDIGHLPRYYVYCERDRALGPAAQRAMVAANPCRRTFSIDSGHSPFLSHPAELAAALLDSARDAERGTGD